MVRFWGNVGRPRQQTCLCRRRHDGDVVIDSESGSNYSDMVNLPALCSEILAGSQNLPRMVPTRDDDV